MAESTNPPATGDPSAADGEHKTLEEIIRDILDGNGLAPLTDLSLGDLLHALGFPAIQLPPPPSFANMPQLPPLDVAGMVRPVLDLAAGFGSGALGSGGSADPTQTLSQISGALQNAGPLTGSAQPAVPSVPSGWQGVGAEQAAAKGQQAQRDSEVAAQQADQIRALVLEGARAVQLGNAQVDAIVHRYFTAMSAAAPFLGTPPGQAWATGMAIQTFVDAGRVLTQTKSELTAKSGAMSVSGAKLPVTNAPTGIDAMAQANQTLRAVAPLRDKAAAGSGSTDGHAPSASTGTTSSEARGAQNTGAAAALPATGALGTPSLPPMTATPAGFAPSDRSAAETAGAPSIAGSTGTGGSAPVLGAAAGAAAASDGRSESRLKPYPGRPLLATSKAEKASRSTPETPEPVIEPRMPVPLRAFDAPETVADAAITPGMPAGAEGLAPFAPTGAARPAARAGDSGTHDHNRFDVVTTQHGEEIVGPLDETGQAVLGAEAETFEEPDTDLLI